MRKLPRLFTWTLLLALCVVAMIHTNCSEFGSEFGQGLQDLTSFCKAVGEKCTQLTPADCVQKLGADSTKLRQPPDYVGAKRCVDELSTCTTLPDRCWFFAVESFNNPTEHSSEVTTDGGRD